MVMTGHAYLSIKATGAAAHLIPRELPPLWEYCSTNFERENTPYFDIRLY